MSTDVAKLDDMGKMAKALVDSKLFGFENVNQAMSIMLIAQAEGRSPALAARDYHVIKGRPALKADAMLARFQQEGGVVEWTKYDETCVTGKFSHPKSCPTPVAITWTIDMAKRIGLAGRDNWRNYPRAMMRARVISEGVRTVYPGIAVGVYTSEEVQDMQREKDITPTAGAGDMLTEAQRVKISDLADRMREWLNSGSLTDAHAEMDNAGLDAEEQIFLWTHFDSRVRRQLKEEGERMRLRAAKTPQLEVKPINDAQRKRLEAIIHESGVSRDEVKAEIFTRYGREHFSELTHDEYETICNELTSSPAQTAPSSSPSSQMDGAQAGNLSMAAPDAAAPFGDNPPSDAQESATLTVDQAVENIRKAIDKDTLAMAVDLAKTVCRNAPDQLKANMAYRDRKKFLVAQQNEKLENA